MIVIYTPKVTNRIKFTLDFVFQQYFGIEISVTENPAIPVLPEHCYINYSGAALPGFYHIFQDTLLLEEDIRQPRIFVSREAELPVFFQTTDSYDLKFDIFSCVFYLISRYEEYLPYEKDMHGRYLASNSILARKEFQFAPVVEYWLLHFKNELLTRYPALEFRQLTFEWIPTFDIDNAFQYLGRDWSVRPPNIFKPEVVKTLLGLQRDPYDIFDELLEEIDLYRQHPIFFFLLSNRTKQDSNVDPKSKRLVQLIRKIASKHEIGIHPSYHAFEQDSIDIERSYLEKLSGKKISISRQHFLRIDFPAYYRKLAACGVQKDYSLGYPELSGFRAGCSRPFYFFDVERNESSTLQIQPTCFMDATYIYYQNSINSSINQNFLTVFNQLKKINGILVPIFHNDLLAVKLDRGFYKFINQRLYIRG